MNVTNPDATRQADSPIPSEGKQSPTQPKLTSFNKYVEATIQPLYLKSPQTAIEAQAIANLVTVNCLDITEARIHQEIADIYVKFPSILSQSEGALDTALSMIYLVNLGFFLHQIETKELPVEALEMALPRSLAWQVTIYINEMRAAGRLTEIDDNAILQQAEDFFINEPFGESTMRQIKQILSQNSTLKR